jgi:excinuclease ABC subunit C
VIEALILEANLIKHYWPHYNIKEKDNKSFLYLVITKEDFPKPLLVRGSDLSEEGEKAYKAVFGPYTSGHALRAALELVRKIFPWSTCTPPDAKVLRPGQQPRACFHAHLHLCPGVCVGAITKADYAKIIRDLIRFFQGKKGMITAAYRREMIKAAKERRFEDAAGLRNKVFALEHIQDVAVIARDDRPDRGPSPSGIDVFGRIEGYDISNTSGTASVASMVVFERGAAAKVEYRKFRIKTVEGANDVASIAETLRRRFRHTWRRPDLVLIDGGWPQVNAARAVMSELSLSIPVIGLAKGPDRDRNDIICSLEEKELRNVCEQNKDILIRVRDEAHRFAVAYHRKLRSREFIPGKRKRV